MTDKAKFVRRRSAAAADGLMGRCTWTGAAALGVLDELEAALDRIAELEQQAGGAYKAGAAAERAAIVVELETLAMSARLDYEWQRVWAQGVRAGRRLVEARGGQSDG